MNKPKPMRLSSSGVKVSCSQGFPPSALCRSLWDRDRRVHCGGLSSVPGLHLPDASGVSPTSPHVTTKCLQCGGHRGHFTLVENPYVNFNLLGPRPFLKVTRRLTCDHRIERNYSFLRQPRSIFGSPLMLFTDSQRLFYMSPFSMM